MTSASRSGVRVKRSVCRMVCGLLLFLSISHCLVYVYAIDDDAAHQLPPILDSDDVAYFFEHGDIDSLHWALETVFSNSQRNPNPTVAAPVLPAQIVARGGGSTYTSAYKLQHDLEQAEYLAETLLNPEEASFFRNVVAPTYQILLEQIPSLDELKRTHGLYAFSTQDKQATHVESIYNKALYRPALDELKDESTGKPIPLVNPDMDTGAYERQWSGEETSHKHPGIIVIDDLLSPRAVSALQRILWESTVWFQTKKPLVFGGYLGAYIDDGLHDRLLLQLATELSERLPRILKGHALKYLWAYKYDSDYTGINLHADQAAVNINIWLTPDSANLDPASGGLVVFTAKAPGDWDFAKYNTDTDIVREQLLRPTGFSNVTVPYKMNRAVIFDSALFHQTDGFKFKKGYTNRRINLTLLYGDMQPAKNDATSTGHSSSEEL